MVNRRIVAVMVLVGCLVAGTGLAQERTLADNWNDFLHFAKIGNLDLAKGYAQAILDSDPDPVALLNLSQANPTGYELATRVVRTANDAELVALTERLLAVIERGRFIRRSDPQIIVEEVRRLDGGTRARMNATERLQNAGEYAIPFMLDAMADPTRSGELKNIIETLPKIGRPAIRPLVAALQMQDSTIKGEIIRALGKIGYTQAIPYLRYVVENESSSELRDLATQSIRQINPSAVNTPAAGLFYQLGDRYYYHDESLAPQQGSPIANVWFWNGTTSRLERAEVAPTYFNELMSMRCCEWSLKSDSQFGLSIGLWLAAFFKAEATGLEMPEYFGQNHASALVYATTAGPEYLHQALSRAMNDKNAAVALGAVEALATNAGEKSLLYAVGPAQPVLQALVFPDRAVRYSAAIAIANAGPRENFNDSLLVVQNLAEALSGAESGQTMTDWTPEMANSYAVRAAQAMLKVGVSRNPVIDLLQAQSALVAATRDSRQQIQTLASDVLAYISSPNAQRAIAESALNADNSMEVRIAAFNSLANSGKMNGSMLAADTIDQIYGLTSSVETEPDLRAAAAAAFGSLNLPSQKVKTLILDQAKS